jgi:hypothetical protein
MIYFVPIRLSISFNCFLRLLKFRKASKGNHLYLMNLQSISIMFSSGEYGGKKNMNKSCFSHC